MSPLHEDGLPNGELPDDVETDEAEGEAEVETEVELGATHEDDGATYVEDAITDGVGTALVDGVHDGVADANGHQTTKLVSVTVVTTSGWV